VTGDPHIHVVAKVVEAGAGMRDLVASPLGDQGSAAVAV
jgi:hypothetical protein